MNTPPPRVVVRSTKARDTLLAVVIAALVLGFVGYGIFQMAQPVQGNKLTGIVTERQFTALKERRIEFSGKKLTGAADSDGEYLLKVRVDSENGRIYEVPVPKTLYDAKNVGDPLTFIRPPSEQH